MGDPVFDEDEIKELLMLPINAAHYGYLQTGAVQCLIDLYDRGVTREEFLNLAQPCFVLYETMAKVWFLSQTKKAFEDNVLNDQMIANTEKALESLARNQAQQVIEIVKRLQECPTSKDTVN